MDFLKLFLKSKSSLSSTFYNFTSHHTITLLSKTNEPYEKKFAGCTRNIGTKSTVGSCCSFSGKYYLFLLRINSFSQKIFQLHKITGFDLALLCNEFSIIVNGKSYVNYNGWLVIPHLVMFLVFSFSS